MTINTFRPAAGANSPVDGEARRSGAQGTFSAVQEGAGTQAQDTTASGPIVTLQTVAAANQYLFQSGQRYFSGIMAKC